MRARFIPAACTAVIVAIVCVAFTQRAHLHEREPAHAREPQQEEEESALDATLRMDQCTPVLAALASALERASHPAR